MMRLYIVARVCVNVVYRADKEKQQLTIEIDGLVTQVDSANKAKVCDVM